MKAVKASAIYADIIARNGINEVDEESYVRNLRNKMTFIVEHIALRKMSDFKNGKNIMIPVNDAPIVRNLIIAALDEENFPCVVDWFNGALDISDASNCHILSMMLEEPIRRAEITGETDSVTVDEWIATIKGILNVDMAINTMKMKHQLEEFRTRTLVRNSTIRLGDVTATDEDGNRSYILQGQHKDKLLPEALLSQITENLSFQNDYFNVLEQIISYMIKDAERKAIPDIETYAIIKNLSNCEKAIEAIASESMVSEYYPMFKKMAMFLRNNPDEARKIEAKTDTKNLETFFE